MVARADGGWRTREVADAFLPTLTEDAENALSTWLDLLVAWNDRIDLTAAKTPDDVVELMLSDAFVVASELTRGATVIDVGTGAGAPGLALALVRPDLRVTLVEPLRKRVAFLRTVLGTLCRADILLVASKGQAFAQTVDNQHGGADVAISRATLEPSTWLAVGGSLIKRGGSVLVMVASRAAIPTSPEGVRLARVTEYLLPFSRKSRVLATFVDSSTESTEGPRTL